MLLSLVQFKNLSIKRILSDITTKMGRYFRAVSVRNYNARLKILQVISQLHGQNCLGKTVLMKTV